MKKIMIIALLILINLSCDTNDPSQVVTANKEIVTKLFEHFNNHDWKSMASLYIPNAEFKDPAYGIGIFKKTHDETIQHYTELHQMFPNIRDSVINIYPSGEKHIAVEFISIGESVEGDKLELPVFVVLTIENGLITKDFVYYDNF